MKLTPELAVMPQPVTDADLIHERRRQEAATDSSGTRRSVLWLRVEAGAVLIACVLSTLLGPALAMVGPLSRAGNLQLFLFCLPQRVFPYQHLFAHRSAGAHTQAFGAEAVLLSAVQWGIVATAFGWLAGGIKTRYIIPMAYVVVLLVTLVTLSLFRAMGLTFDIDLP